MSKSGKVRKFNRRKRLRAQRLILEKTSDRLREIAIKQRKENLIYKKWKKEYQDKVIIPR